MLKPKRVHPLSANKKASIGIRLDADVSDDEALRELEIFLTPFIEAAERGKISEKSVEKIFNQVHLNH